MQKTTQRHASPLLPNYAFTLCVLLLCLLPPFISSSAEQKPFKGPLPNAPIAREGDHPFPPKTFPPKTLTLKRIYHHGSAGGPFSNTFRRLDFSAGQLSAAQFSADEETSFTVNSQIGKTFKPSAETFRMIRSIRTNGGMRDFMKSKGVDAYRWGFDLLPDVTDNDTVVSLAKMTNNAYNDANKREDWYDMEDKWGLNISFGWETDGLRGHIFGDADNTTLVIAIKGTSAGIFGGGDTAVKDKFNDNLLFSCCCARVGSSWKTVCDCYRGDEYSCDGECVQSSLESEELYYSIAKDLVDDYTNATIWATGHSLGGALAGLLGLTYGLPTVTYEAPGELLAARRLHLPYGAGVDYSQIPMWHIGHTADPVFMGVCTGPSSSCWYGGFAMESQCHTGRVCVYDVVNQSGWKVDIRSHRIHDVIERVLTVWEEVPECFVEEGCVDCGIWDFNDTGAVLKIGATEMCGV
ncbi:putative lipase ATG15 [Jimgerdemannia flammicorona]|uniref:triacylglycerol lipase n=1 Tax=Jimgerdemannia flammicorona TaxID=994334 RepID=A0A433QRC2_9FUNG|nr:putative lipase ATG15 [Jimgerdemannia flammicorona]